ncbi:MAG: 16S rRNA (cytosine(1402)-N(4))-methyltransferase RsmH [Patescibacteria group bacterium]|nr:16S rRNA (cytosine(1402)-N(4))-methyltransferase RsmH [Patescibacteria group bacterium]
MPHVPVLLKETVEALDPKEGETLVDGTVGSGGHLSALLQKMNGRGRFVAVDLDEKHLYESKEKIEKEYPQAKQFWVKGNYGETLPILNSLGISAADMLLLDLGFSSEHLASGRGFSFLKPQEDLDMRYDVSLGASASDIINGSTEEELADIFWRYGEERFSKRVAKEIVRERKEKKIELVGELLEVVKRSIPLRGRINPATRIFQALRIAVNDELGNLARLLSDIPAIVNTDGRVAIISFHSLEDRMVKTAFRNLSKEGKAELIFKKPVTPTFGEIKQNPRSRSAKLRAIRMKLKAEYKDNDLK